MEQYSCSWGTCHPHMLYKVLFKVRSGVPGTEVSNVAGAPRIWLKNHWTLDDHPLSHRAIWGYNPSFPFIRPFYRAYNPIYNDARGGITCPFERWPPLLLGRKNSSKSWKKFSESGAWIATCCFFRRRKHDPQKPPLLVAPCEVMLSNTFWLRLPATKNSQISNFIRIWKHRVDEKMHSFNFRYRYLLIIFAYKCTNYDSYAYEWYCSHPFHSDAYGCDSMDANIALGTCPPGK